MNAPLEFGISITPVYNISGEIGLAAGEHFVGPASRWVEEIGRLAEAGIDAFIFWPGGENPVGQAEAFASEVAPVVRAGGDAPARTS